MPADNLLFHVTQDGNFRAKVRAIEEDIEARGYKPFVASAKRTQAQQRDKVNSGVSKTMRSFHVKRGSDGGSMAADVADRDKGWNVERRFWFILGASAMARDVGWGGLFGLSRAQRYQLRIVLRELSKGGFPENSELYNAKMGWDPAHLQTGSNW